MRKIKSLILTLLISGVFLGAMYFIPIQVEKKAKIEIPEITEEEAMLGEGEEEENIELPAEIDIPEIVMEAPALEEEKEEPKEEVAKVEPEASQKEEKNKDSKKADDKKIANQKEEDTSEIENVVSGNRKLVAGIPGTLNYKGKFPSHNVKEKGSITITYTVDASGKVISAHRSAGLRSRNAINNAVILVKKYVKAEKAKTKSTGTYTIEFK